MQSLDKITKHKRFRPAMTFLIVGTMMFVLITALNPPLSIVKNTTVVQINSPTGGTTMSTGTLTISVRFYPATAPQGSWPVARAYRVLVEEVVVSGQVIRTETKRDIFDETVSVPESDAPFTVTKYVPITNNLKHTITVYLLTYDSYIDWLNSQENGDPPPTGPYPTEPLPFSIVSPSSGENVYYNSINIYVETGETPAEEVDPNFTTTTALGEGHVSPSFGLLSVLLALPVLLKIKHRKKDKE